MKRLSFVLITGLVFSLLCVPLAVAQSGTLHVVPASSAPTPVAPTPATLQPPSYQPYTPAGSEEIKNPANVCVDEKKELTPEEKKKAEAKAKREAEKQKKAQRKAAHLKIISKLSFDRRPSAMLKAWCGLAAEEEAEAKKERLKKEKEQKEKEAKEKEKEEKEEKEAAAKAAKEKAAADQKKGSGSGKSSTTKDDKKDGKDKGGKDKKDGKAEKDKKDGKSKKDEKAKKDKKNDKDKKDKKEKEEKDPFPDEIKVFSRNVTLGKWDEVKKYIARIDEDEGEALYKKLLQSLQGSSSNSSGEQPVMTFDDLFALADAAPFDLDKDNTLGLLSNFVSLAIGQGHVIEEFIHRLKLDVEKPKGAIFTRRQAAKLLCKSSHTIHMGEFLPSIKIAKTNKDHEALNLLSQYQLALYAKDKKMVNLEKAWEVTQAVLGEKGKIDLKQKQEALARAVELAPKLPKKVGRKWLEESFTTQPKRGKEILATIGSKVSQSFQKNRKDAKKRLKLIQLQMTAVDALINAAPEKANQWRPALTVLATNWLAEAAISHQYDTSTSYGPSMRRDNFGNIFYFDELDRYERRFNYSNEPDPIKSSELLDVKPSDTWLDMLPNLKPRLAMLYAQLLLKVNEEDAAFPYIEKLAKTHPDQAAKLAEEFLKVWTTNHDPNASRSRTSHYMFMYGYEEKAEGIPLTRSKQNRNLVELAGWVKRLNALPVKKIDEKLLAKAFTKCHSEAEVYRIDAIEQIFGPIGEISPKTIAEMMKQMRVCLLAQWRKPDVQKKNKTNRKQKAIQIEVLKGYLFANALLDEALKKRPNEWRLVLAKAMMEHDENNYLGELQKDPEFTKRRKKAMADFARAAKLYAAEVPELDKNEITSEVFDIWFYASLGECDLGRITEEASPDLKQPALIRQTILNLPGEAAEKHMGMFANNIFTRMSAVKPAIKFRYLRGAFEIVGDHKQAHEARKVYQYYKDLVTELKLETKVDGSATVACDEPFGVFVNIIHTKEIERESGGFGRYLQNQNSSNYYYYNYGRPKNNYRERFEETVNQALSEHFEVLSITFQTEKVHSRTIDVHGGWRKTPYAYILLKPRGKQIDKIQPLRLDFDFLDTSGYVVLPIESPPLPIQVVEKDAGQRPVENLEVTQILDERQAEDGKLILEVKATGQGLIPDLDTLMDIAPEGFEVDSVEDQELAVSKFAEDTDKNCVASERSWLVTLKAKDHLAELPKEFTFAKPKMKVKKSLLQRYADADLVTAKAVVPLEYEYGELDYTIYWILGAAAFVLLLLVVLAIVAIQSNLHKQQPTESIMPKDITPFSVLSMLRAVEQHHDLSDTHREELSDTISHIERHYFVASRSNGSDTTPSHTDEQGHHAEPDLIKVARTWSKKLRP